MRSSSSRAATRRSRLRSSTNKKHCRTRRCHRLPARNAAGDRARGAGRGPPTGPHDDSQSRARGGTLPADWFALIDYLIPNELEAATLSGIAIATPDDARRAARVLKEKGARNVIVTLGAQGVFALLGDDSDGQHLPSPKVEAVDTTAAGDTFIGGFAAELARGSAVADAIAFGQRAAALAVTREGAQPSIPRRSEIAA